MRKELEEIYENLFLDYNYDLKEGYRPLYFRNRNLNRLIHRQIVVEEDNYIRKNQNSNNFVKLRSDAKYFLMLIYYQMVALPLQHPMIDVKQEDLEKYIMDDIKLLLNSGYSTKETAEVKEVTAHTLLSAIDKNWERLNISNFKLWNR